MIPYVLGIVTGITLSLLNVLLYQKMTSPLIKKLGGVFKHNEGSIVDTEDIYEKFNEEA